MNASASEPLSQSPGNFLLPMRDMAHIFNAPPVDPLSPSPPEVLGVSGARYVLQQFETRRQVKAETLRIVLPDAKISGSLAEQTHQGLLRYAPQRQHKFKTAGQQADSSASYAHLQESPPGPD